jgi:hypothetical protein
MSHLSSSVRNESFSNGNTETSSNVNYMNYINQGFKSKQHTPELSKRNIDMEGSLFENQKEKQFMEENILRIFQEQNSSGRQINTGLLRQILKDNPELFENRKSKTSTNDDTIKNTNYSTKNVDSDSIESMHFMFVNFFHKSKQIVNNQENPQVMPIDQRNLLTVCPCEEIDIE